MEQQSAVGVVETRGMIPLLAALEAMIKSTAVELLTVQKIGGGFVVLAVRGHLASVNSAMEVARQAIAAYGDGRYTHIYARPHRRSTEVLADPLGDSAGKPTADGAVTQ